MGNTLSESFVDKSLSRQKIIDFLGKIDVTVIEDDENEISAIDNNEAHMKASRRIESCSEEEIDMISDFILKVGSQDRNSFLGELKLELAYNDDTSISEIITACESTLGPNNSNSTIISQATSNILYL